MAFPERRGGAAGRAAVRGPLSRPRLRRAAAGLSCNRRTCRPGIGRPSVTSGPHGSPGELTLGSAWRPRLFLTLLPGRWPLGLSDGTRVSRHHSVPEGTALRCSVLPPGGCGAHEALTATYTQTPSPHRRGVCPRLAGGRGLAVIAVPRGQRAGCARPGPGPQPARVADFKQRVREPGRTQPHGHGTLEAGSAGVRLCAAHAPLYQRGEGEAETRPGERG